MEGNQSVSEGHYKDLTVSLNPIDEKALSRTTTRRRRRTAGGGGGGGNDASAANVGNTEVLKEGAVASPVPLPAPATMDPISVPAPVPVVMQIPSVAPVSTIQASVAAEAAVTPVPTAPLVGGSVRIVAKKNASFVGGAPAALVPHLLPKIIPSKKRISSAPASATLKKPRFIVSTLPASSPAQAREVTEIPKHSSGEQQSLKPRRRFTERRISIEVKSAASTRKNRRHLKERIDAMPITAVRKILMRKGILKPKVTLPPESMMRSMLKDYMLLHTAE